MQKSTCCHSKYCPTYQACPDNLPMHGLAFQRCCCLTHLLNFCLAALLSLSDFRLMMGAISEAFLEPVLLNMVPVSCGEK